jgi:hypothetical protein
VWSASVTGRIRVRARGYSRQVIELRRMVAGDLGCVARWFREPHVARWWLPDTTAEAELEKLSQRLSGAGDQMTRTLTVLEGSDRRQPAQPIGWCQWYPYDAYPPRQKRSAPSRVIAASTTSSSSGRHWTGAGHAVDREPSR